jgi:hypothetical protein
VGAMEEATLADLADVPGIGVGVARGVYERLHEPEESAGAA